MGRNLPDWCAITLQILGFTYLTASNKEEYRAILDQFVNPEIADKPMLLEVFTDHRDESDALNLINHIVVDPPTATDVAKKLAKGLLGDKGCTNFKTSGKRVRSMEILVLGGTGAMGQPACTVAKKSWA